MIDHSNETSVAGDTTAPLNPSVTAPGDGVALKDKTPTFEGSAEPESTVAIFVDGNQIGTTPADAAGNWSYTVPDAAALTDSNHTVRVTATDASGNVSGFSASIGFTVDTVAPSAIVLMPTPGSATTDATPSIGGRSEAGSTVEVFVDGNSIGTTTADSSQNWSIDVPNSAALSDGTHRVWVTATDAAGNGGIPSTGVTFTVDATPPTKPTINGIGSTNDTTPTIVGTAEAGTTITVSIDGASIGTTTTNGDGSWSFTPSAALSQGFHNVSVVATDSFNRSSPTSGNTNFVVDTSPPSAPVVITPANGSITNDTTPVLSGVAESNSTVNVVVDGVFLGTATANASGNWSYTVLDSAALGEGSHTVRTTAQDAAGNLSAISNTNTFSIDSTPPSAPVIVTPANNGAVSDTTPLFTGTAERGATITVRVDNVVIGMTTANASGAWTLDTQNAQALGQGAHTVTVRATDAAGNTSADGTGSFRVDTVAPAAPVVITPANGVTTNDTTPTLTGTAESNSTVQVVVDGISVGTTTANASGNWALTIADGAGLGQGSHTVRTTAQDAAGNVSVNSNTNTFTVDSVAPDAPRIIVPGNGSTTNNNKPALVGKTEAYATVAVTLDGQFIGTATADYLGNWILNTPDSMRLADGSHTVIATVTDAAGNASVPSTSTFSVDATPPAAPAITSMSNGSATNDNTPTITGTAEPDVFVRVFIDGAQIGITQANASGVWTITQFNAMAEGAHTVYATAQDGANNTSASSSTISFTVDTQPPAAPSAPDLTSGSDLGSSNNDNITSDTTPTFSGTALAGATVYLYDGSTQIGSTMATIGGTWTITSTELAHGSHTITAKAMDAAGNVSAAGSPLTVTIDTQAPAAPSAPVLTTDDGYSDTDNRTSISTPTFTGTAESGTTVTLYAGNTAVGSAVAAGGIWSITTTTLAPGDYIITAQATDEFNQTGNPSGPLSVHIVARPGLDLNGADDGTGSSGDFVENSAVPTFVAPAATVNDVEGVGWANGSMVVEFTAGEQPGDEVKVFDFVGVEGAVHLSGDQVVFDDVAFGTIGRAQNGALKITFNADATADMIQQLLRQIGYTNASDSPGDGTRTIHVGLSDATYYYTTRTAEVTVQATDDPLVPTNDIATVAENGTVEIDVFANDDPDGPLQNVISIDDQPLALGETIQLDSGALVTVGLDGKLTYDPNGAFNSLVGAETGGANTTATDSFIYSTGSGYASVTVTIEGVTQQKETIQGGAGTNTLNGDASANTLDGGAGADVMSGGDGNDLYIVDDLDDQVIEAENQGSDVVRSSISYTLRANVEHLILSGNANIDGTGNSLNNAIIGNSGNNVLDGGGGADTLTGGAGDDSYYVNNDDGVDKIVELANGGHDTAYASSSYVLTGIFVEDLNLLGTADLNGRGNNLANVITGNSGKNQLMGDGGNDVLDGGAGADTLIGGLDDDIYIVDNAGDNVVEAFDQGVDTVKSSVSYNLGGRYVERLELTGHGAIYGTGNGQANTIIGNDAANTLQGLNGDDTLDGGAGADKLYGGVGNDTYYVDNAADRVFEQDGEGYDIVYASVTYTAQGQYVEDVVLTGNAASNATGNSLANMLTGNEAANRLNGGAGDDVLNGGLGGDTLTGGAGADIFRFDHHWIAFDTDTITDFVSGTDKIQLDLSVYGITNFETALHFGTAPQNESQHLIYDQATGNLWWDADGSSFYDEARLIAQLKPGTVLTADDFTFGGL